MVKPSTVVENAESEKNKSCASSTDIRYLFRPVFSFASIFAVLPLCPFRWETTLASHRILLCYCILSILVVIWELHIKVQELLFQASTWSVRHKLNLGIMFFEIIMCFAFRVSLLIKWKQFGKHICSWQRNWITQTNYQEHKRKIMKYMLLSATHIPLSNLFVFPLCFLHIIDHGASICGAIMETLFHSIFDIGAIFIIVYSYGVCGLIKACATSICEDINKIAYLENDTDIIRPSQWKPCPLTLNSNWEGKTLGYFSLNLLRSTRKVFGIEKAPMKDRKSINETCSQNHSTGGILFHTNGTHCQSFEMCCKTDGMCCQSEGVHKLKNDAESQTSESRYGDINHLRESVHNYSKPVSIKEIRMKICNLYGMLHSFTDIAGPSWMCIFSVAVVNICFVVFFVTYPSRGDSYLITLYHMVLIIYNVYVLLLGMYFGHVIEEEIVRAQIFVGSSRLDVSAAGLFTIGFHLLVPIVGSIITYMVVLIQLG